MRKLGAVIPPRRVFSVFERFRSDQLTSAGSPFQGGSAGSNPAGGHSGPRTQAAVGWAVCPPTTLTRWPRSPSGSVTQKVVTAEHYLFAIGDYAEADYAAVLSC